jgi:hypothetical protein
MSPPPRTVLAVPWRSEGGESQESRRPRDGQCRSLRSARPRDAGGSGRRSRPTRDGGSGREQKKRSPGRRGRRLWRDETQEGIGASGPQGLDGQNELDAGIEALKPTASARSLGARRIDAGNGRRAGTPERESYRREEKALKGEARGRSGTERSPEGRWSCREGGIQTSRGAPRGWTPRGDGRPSRDVSWGAKAQRRKHRPPRGPFAVPGRCGGAAMDL